MKIGEIISKQRRELGLTQEQVASYLGVSTPAVNKWEHGTTCPDIELLCPLARLLKIDVNTLLGYQENLSEEEINEIVKHVGEIVQPQAGADASPGSQGANYKEKMEQAFGEAVAKVQEYPNSDGLRYKLALLMEGLLIMETGTTEHASYKETIMKWYESCIASKDETIRNSTLYMLASKCIAKGDFEQAQSYIEQLPERTENDKNVLAINILLGKGEAESAAELSGKMVESIIQDLQMYMIKLVDAELQDGNVERAGKLADMWHEVAKMLGIWEYSSYVGQLEVAVQTKNEEESIRVLKAMLRAIHEPVYKKDCVIYERNGKGENVSSGEVFLPGIVKSLEEGAQYDFLRDNQEFQAILKECQD